MNPLKNMLKKSISRSRKDNLMIVRNIPTGKEYAFNVNKIKEKDKNWSSARSTIEVLTQK